MSDTTRFPKDNSLPLWVACFLFSLMATGLLCVTRVKWRSAFTHPPRPSKKHNTRDACVGDVQNRGWKMKAGQERNVNARPNSVTRHPQSKAHFWSRLRQVLKQAGWPGALSPTSRRTGPQPGCPSPQQPSSSSASSLFILKVAHLPLTHFTPAEPHTYGEQRATTNKKNPPLMTFIFLIKTS